MQLFIVPLSISNKKLRLFINSYQVAKFSWSKPLQVKIKNKGTYNINLKEGYLKNHYFKLKIEKDILLYLKKKFDGFGTTIVISEDKQFRTLIAWSRD